MHELLGALGETPVPDFSTETPFDSHARTDLADGNRTDLADGNRTDLADGDECDRLASRLLHFGAIANNVLHACPNHPPPSSRQKRPHASP